MKRFISEDDIERACIEVCTDNLGYKTFNCMNQDYLNRKSEREVLYEYRIKRCLKKINAHLTDRKEGLSDDEIDEFWRYADILLNPTDRRAQFNVYDNTISALYNELQPEILKRKSEFEMAGVIHYLRQIMDNNIDSGNMDTARKNATRLLDISIVPRERMCQRVLQRASENRMFV